MSKPYSSLQEAAAGSAADFLQQLVVVLYDMRLGGEGIRMITLLMVGSLETSPHGQVLQELLHF